MPNRNSFELNNEDEDILLIGKCRQGGITGAIGFHTIIIITFIILHSMSGAAVCQDYGFEDVVDTLNTSIVAVALLDHDSQAKPQIIGMAFRYGPNDMLVSNFHLLSVVNFIERDKQSLIIVDKSQTQYQDIEVFAFNRRTDLILFRVPGLTAPPLTSRSAATLRPAEKVVAIGNSPVH